MLEKYIEKIIKRGNSHYVKVDAKKMKEDDLHEGDYVVVDLKKVEL